MITAEEFLVDDRWFKEPLTEKEKVIYLESIITHQDYIHRMIEFAKLHVEAALKEASKNGSIIPTARNGHYINKNSILNAYPLDNIK